MAKLKNINIQMIVPNIDDIILNKREVFAK